MRRTRSFKVLASCLIAIAVICACGCGSDAPAKSESASFLGTPSNGAILIQWVRTGDTLSGSIQQSLLKSESGPEMNSESGSFTGTIHNGAVALKLDKGFGTFSTLVGHARGSNLVLTYPGEGGTLIDLELKPGGVRGFNAAVRDVSASSIATACTLYAENYDAKLQFSGETAGDDCQRFADSIATGEVNWSTDGHDAVGYTYETVCALTNGTDLVEVLDTGEQAVGTQACDDLKASDDGWSEPTDP